MADSRLKRLIILIFMMAMFRSSYILTLIILGRKFMHRDYASSDCLLLIANSTSPERFKEHPFLSGVTYHTNCDVENFVKMQRESDEKGNLERIMILFGVIFFLTAIPYWRDVISFKFLLVTIITPLYFVTLDYHFLQFGEDAMYLTGNILHSAALEARLGASQTQGMAIIALMTYLWSVSVKSVAISFFPRLGKFMPRAVWLFSGYVGACIFYIAKNRPDTAPLASNEKSTNFGAAVIQIVDWRIFQVSSGRDETGSGPAFFYDLFYSAVLQGYSYVHNDIFSLNVNSGGHFTLMVITETVVGTICTFFHMGLMLFIEKIFSYVVRGLSTLFKFVAPRRKLIAQNSVLRSADVSAKVNSESSASNITTPNSRKKKSKTK
jgi:hypothetical protein